MSVELTRQLSKSSTLATVHPLIGGDCRFVVYGQKPGQPNQQPQDDSIFGSHTAHQSQPQHQQDGEMSGQGSSQEPPYQQESRPDRAKV